MSRSAAARAVEERHRERLRPRPHGLPATRRISGPARPPVRPAVRPPAMGAAVIASDAVLVPPLPRTDPRHRPSAQRAAQRPPLRLAAGGAAIALRVGETAMQVSGSRAMDRVVLSRAWVVIVAFALIGIVAMQVSMLKLNSGIGRAVDSVATLERANATLKADISRLSSGDRIRALAGARGFRMPAPADLTFLRAGDLRTDGARAARRMVAPDASIAGPAGATSAASVSAALTGEAPAANPATTTAAAPATEPAATTPPAAVTAPPATTAPASTAAAPPAANGAVAPATPDAAAPRSTSSGGVTLP